jgi:hypothetical protein
VNLAALAGGAGLSRDRCRRLPSGCHGEQAGPSPCSVRVEATDNGLETTSKIKQCLRRYVAR